MIKTRCFDGIIPFSFPPKISEIPSLVLNKKSVSFLFVFRYFFKDNVRGGTLGYFKGEGDGKFCWDITNYLSYLRKNM